MGVKFNPIEGIFDLTSGSTGNIKTENIELNSTMITNKQLTLTEIPINNNQVLLDIPSGITQAYGIDFVVMANVLSWNGMGLETILEVNDRLRVVYQY